MGLNDDPLELRIELSPDSEEWGQLEGTLELADVPGARVITNVDEYVDGFKFFFLRTRSGDQFSFLREDLLNVMRRWPGGRWQPVRLHRRGGVRAAVSAPPRRPR